MLYYSCMYTAASTRSIIGATTLWDPWDASPQLSNSLGPSLQLMTIVRKQEPKMHSIWYQMLKIALALTPWLTLSPTPSR